ncbi:mercuric reductase [Elioraea sp. Yellowstone]|jgi:mercuric ion transport protein|uniref:mercuric reductase n=1 Tax=Elioraea sp. Yellowstone TaxID=2592070 RepID=UPI00114F33F9|nr:mercuric reductase [Elioraea sp. Yellowstone]TQF77647.1 mercuric reductase [Elioraea sp. Yellowstone]
MLGQQNEHRTPRGIAAAAALFSLAGAAAAFGVAACCALPLGLAAVGLGTAWLGGIALAAAPHQGVLMGLSAASLIGAAALLLSARRRAACLRDGSCKRPAFRSVTIAGLLVGGVLLGAGYAFA